MPFSVDFDKVVRWVTNRWERPSTILIILLCLSVLGIWIFTAIDLADLSLPEIVIISIVVLSVFFVWWRTNAVPKAQRGRVGFAVAIACETEELENTIAADFTGALKRHLRQDTYAYEFSFVEFPQRLARRIVNKEDINRIRSRARCHFIVFGTAKDRMIGGSRKHVLDLSIGVAHRPIPERTRRDLSREMTEMFPQQLRIDAKDDFIGFEFTSEWVDCVAKYVIGLASLVSGDLEYAESLLRGLWDNAHIQRSPLPPLMKMRQRIPIRLGDIYASRAIQAHGKWRQHRDPALLEEMESHLVLLRRFHPEHHTSRLLSAIYFFAARRNVDAAIREIRKCRGSQVTPWRYSYAFLLAYRGEMRKAKVMYRYAFRHGPADPNLHCEVEEFILWVLQIEPDKIQLYFCLGLVNWHAKMDKKRAIQYFRKFLSSEDRQRFPDEARLAEIYVGQLETELAVRSEQQAQELCSE